jgi:transcription antitermination factor NusG
MMGVLNMSSLKNLYRISYPIEDKEMMHVLNLMYNFSNTVNRARDSRTYRVKDKVRIVSGPFANFEGIVAESNYPAHGEAKIKVCTKMFNSDFTFVIVNEFQVEAL